MRWSHLAVSAHPDENRGALHLSQRLKYPHWIQTWRKVRAAMNSSMTRQLREIDQELHQSAERGHPCPECGYGLQLVFLTGDEPEPICDTCERPKARGEGVQVVRIRERKDGPQ